MTNDTGRSAHAFLLSLLDMLADHPLSIELVAPHLKALTPARIRNEFGDLVAKFANGDAFEARNRLFLASLEFSKRRLSTKARQVLPYLTWFQGGVFEKGLLTFTELDATAWAAIRAELVATALLKVEELPQFKTPFLRFHPTLPYAARAGAVLDLEAAERRFTDTYLMVIAVATGMLDSNYCSPVVVMTLLAREEGNLRSAMCRAFQRGDQQAAVAIADLLDFYLGMAGRMREKNELRAWILSQLPRGNHLEEILCNAIREHSMSLVHQGQASDAIKTVKNL
jgi:hypothetical protein